MFKSRYPIIAYIIFFKFQECGCVCSKCVNDHDVHLHVEIENLKQRLLERDTHIVTMETNVLNEANKFPNGQVVAVKEELLMCQEKYKRCVLIYCYGTNLV